MPGLFIHDHATSKIEHKCADCLGTLCVSVGCAGLKPAATIATSIRLF